MNSDNNFLLWLKICLIEVLIYWNKLVISSGIFLFILCDNLLKNSWVYTSWLVIFFYFPYFNNLYILF